MFVILILEWFLVLILNGRYKGQNPIRLVRIKRTASTSKMIPNTPEITLVKNNTAIRTAIRILTTMSMVPMFFFMNFGFRLILITANIHYKDLCSFFFAFICLFSSLFFPASAVGLMGLGTRMRNFF